MFEDLRRNSARIAIIVAFFILATAIFNYVIPRITCVPTGTQVTVSLSSLKVNCAQGLNCLEIINDRLSIDDGSIDINNDPLYTGINQSSGHAEDSIGNSDEDPIDDMILTASECNDPPPLGGDSDWPMDIRHSFPTKGTGIVDDGVSEFISSVHKMQNKIKTPDTDKFMRVRTCEDKNSKSTCNFLSISIFKKDFEEMREKYARMVDAKNGTNSSFTSSINTQELTQSFTVSTQSSHHVTIVQTKNTDYILRFASNDPSRFSKSIVLVP